MADGLLVNLANYTSQRRRVRAMGAKGQPVDLIAGEKTSRTLVLKPRVPVLAPGSATRSGLTYTTAS